MAQALELFRSAPRFLTARTVGDRMPGLVSGPLAPLRLVNKADPVPTRDGWARVKPLLSGICGSDLSTLAERLRDNTQALARDDDNPLPSMFGETMK